MAGNLNADHGNFTMQNHLMMKKIRNLNIKLNINFTFIIQNHQILKVINLNIKPYHKINTKDKNYLQKNKIQKCDEGSELIEEDKS